MAGVSTEQGSNSLDVELNLVPFIDLLSVLVLFLLVTTVWLQVSAIQATVDAKGRAVNAQNEQKKLMIRVTANGYKLSWPSHLAGRMPSSLSRDPHKITSILQKLDSAKLPLTGVGGDDGVPYSAVIAAIDAAKAAGVGTVALSAD